MTASPASAQRPTGEELLDLLDSTVRKDIVEHETVEGWIAFRIQTFPTGGTRPIQACGLSHQGAGHTLDFYEVRYPMVVDGHSFTGRTDRLVLRAGTGEWDYTRKWTMEMQLTLHDGPTPLDRKEVFFTPLPVLNTHFVGEFQSHSPRDIFAWLAEGSALKPNARVVARIEGREADIALARFATALSAFERMCESVVWFNAETLK